MFTPSFNPPFIYSHLIFSSSSPLKHPLMEDIEVTKTINSLHAKEEAKLAELGYKQELPRKLSMMSILGLSFAIMAVPFGLSTTMGIGLTDGQCVTIFWGWCLVSLISLSIAASLAEICMFNLRT